MAAAEIVDVTFLAAVPPLGRIDPRLGTPRPSAFLVGITSTPSTVSRGYRARRPARTLRGCRRRDAVVMPSSAQPACFLIADISGLHRLPRRRRAGPCPGHPGRPDRRGRHRATAELPAGQARGRRGLHLDARRERSTARCSSTRSSAATSASAVGAGTCARRRPARATRASASPTWTSSSWSTRRGDHPEGRWPPGAAGSDVIVVHRLLKNDVVESLGIKAYALLSQAATDAAGIDPAALGVAARGDVRADRRGAALGPRPRAPLAGRGGAGRVRVAAEEASLDLTVPTGVPPQVAWEFLTRPGQRMSWQPWVTEVRVEGATGGRRGVGSANHCRHGKDAVIEEILDWRPYDYVTDRTILDTPDGPVKVLHTIELEPVPSGTIIHLRFGAARPSASRRRWRTSGPPTAPRSSRGFPRSSPSWMRPCGARGRARPRTGTGRATAVGPAGRTPAAGEDRLTVACGRDLGSSPDPSPAHPGRSLGARGGGRIDDRLGRDRGGDRVGHADRPGRAGARSAGRLHGDGVAARGLQSPPRSALGAAPPEGPPATSSWRTTAWAPRRPAVEVTVIEYV